MPGTIPRRSRKNRSHTFHKSAKVAFKVLFQSECDFFFIRIRMWLTNMQNHNLSQTTHYEIWIRENFSYKVLFSFLILLKIWDDWENKQDLMQKENSRNISSSRYRTKVYTNLSKPIPHIILNQYIKGRPNLTKMKV